MRDSLPDEQIQSYRENGFVAVEGFLDASDLQRWREAVDDAVEQRGDQWLPGFAMPKRPENEYYRNVFTQRINLWKTSEAMRSLVFDERIGKVAAALEGVDGIRIYHDQALIKQAWGNPTGFHLDNPYWPFTSPHAISIWVALDDATLSNGAMCYVPGSHRKVSTRNVGIGPEIGALFEVYPEIVELGVVHCPVPAGTAVFHNGLVAHGAGANMTPGRRRAMTVQMMPDGATFNGGGSVLPPDYVKSLKVGDPLDSDDHNPLIWAADGRHTQRKLPPVIATGVQQPIA